MRVADRLGDTAVIPIAVKIRERGATPRRLRKVHNVAAKVAYGAIANHFHAAMRDARFTNEHGRKAGYAPRRGEESGTSGAAFWKSYTGWKKKKFGHTRPLEWSGETRRLVRLANISATAKRSRVAYPGARKFNFRHPASTINMADEFRRLIPEEATELGGVYDAHYGKQMNQDTSSETIKV